MSLLHLIRHGQASFGAEDYDVLSPTGIQQARALGAHFAAARLDAVYTGPRRRQRDTAEHLRDAARAAGATLPETQLIDEFDEYPAFEIFKYVMPILLDSDEAIRALAAASSDGRVFEEVIRRWLCGALDCGPHEAFDAFAVRVRRGLARVMAAEGRGRTVAVVTSGGPISVAVQLALDLAPEVLLRLQAVTYNASISDFKFSADRLSLVTFNNINHLTGRAPPTVR